MHQVKLCNPDQVLPKLQRQGDFFIMEHMVASQGFSKDDMIHINHCRLAFRAMTAADILTGDGIKVTKNTINLRRLSRPSSTWDWPNESPSNKDISRWKSGLKQVTSANFSLPFSIPHIFIGNGSTGNASIIFTTTEMEYGISMYHFLLIQLWLLKQRVGIVASPPIPIDNLERATIWYDQGQVMFEGSAGTAYSPSPTHDTIYDFIADWEDSWPIAESFFPEDPVLITQAINAGMAVMVRDGLYKPLLLTEIGATAWILECSATSVFCFGEGSTSGLRNKVNAYRSEIQGCHASYLGLLAFCIYHDIHEGSIKFHFNNNAGLDKAAKGHLNVSMKYKHSHLIQAI
jgi:hypothetical protein